MSKFMEIDDFGDYESLYKLVLKRYKKGVSLIVQYEQGDFIMKAFIQENFKTLRALVAGVKFGCEKSI